MENLKIKLIRIVVIFVLAIATTGISVYATDADFKILHNTDDDEYLIYIENYLGTNFEFAFSIDSNVEPTIFAEESDGKGNCIALVNSGIKLSSSAFNGGNTAYLWVREVGAPAGSYIIEGALIDLSNSITDVEMSTVGGITTPQIGYAKSTKTTKTQSGNTETTLTVGVIEILDAGSYTYRIISSPRAVVEYMDFMDLFDEIISETFEIDNDMYEKLVIYKEFIGLYRSLLTSELGKEWTEVEGNEILQPGVAQEGTEYIVWIKGGSIVDFHLMVSTREEIKEIIKGEVTNLPVTGDDNALVAIFIILVVAIIIVSTSSVKIKGGRNEN